LPGDDIYIQNLFAAANEISAGMDHLIAPGGSQEIDVGREQGAEFVACNRQGLQRAG